MYSIDSDYFFFPLFFTERLPCHLWKPGGWRHRAHSEPRPARTLNGCPTRLLAARTHPMMLHGKARPARGSSVPTSGQGLNPIFSTVPNRTKTPQKWFQGFLCRPELGLAFRGVQNVLDLKTVFIVLEMKFAMNFIPKAINTIFSSSHRGSLAKNELKTIFIALEMKSR